MKEIEMSKRLIWSAVAATGLMIGGVANANQPEDAAQAAKPVAAKAGQTVTVDGKEVAVCTKDVQDSCINPRAAGLNWGNRPLDYWPGKPASEKGPVSQEQPEQMENPATEEDPST
tara:strand:- start:4555 stop:4902 length:348 start_codon:yes stop_codon:yes gene_type:complete